ncbi:MAG: PhzF family phenazine biosynthesis protein [Nitrospinaceae bacterium]|nr:PhzF family phenazine biosynthesis protein [Nitrospinaceae bacterium]
MLHPLIQVDAFADRPFAGNPAAICLLEAPAREGWMQALAMEMNLSETAYVYPFEDGFNLRWFTPAAEVDLCGHATLGAAHALWETGRLAEDAPARFHTKSGLLTCTKVGDWIEMDFPAAEVKGAAPPDELIEGLGITPRYVGRTPFDYMVGADSAETLRGLAPDFPLLARVDTRGVIVTARSDRPEYDFISRFFAPGHGINEDPVTGSAHCALAPFWGERLHKTELIGYQASPRGGVVRCRVQDDRVILGGQAVTVLRGEVG